MKTGFGIFSFLGVTFAGPFVNEDKPTLPWPTTSCDIFKNDTQRAILFQGFFEKVDKNDDQSLSYSSYSLLDDNLELDDLISGLGSYEYHEMRNLDQDKNKKINGQEICGLLDYIWDKAEREVERQKRKILNDPNFKLAFESFSDQLVSIRKGELINWLSVLYTQSFEYWVDSAKALHEVSLMGEFIFLFSDNDMSGELTHEELYLTFDLFYEGRSDKLPPFVFSKTAYLKWPEPSGIEDKLPLGLASCDVFKNDTERAVSIQNFSDKVDKNSDGSLSAKELSAFGFDHFSECYDLSKLPYDYDNYKKTGWEYCKLDKYNAGKYDQDKNNEISGQEMCGFWNDFVDKVRGDLGELYMDMDEENSKNDYEEFFETHPELDPITKDRFIKKMIIYWNELMSQDESEGQYTESFELMSEFFFLVLDEDLSGVLDSYKEKYVVFKAFSDLEKRRKEGKKWRDP